MHAKLFFLYVFVLQYSQKLIYKFVEFLWEMLKAAYKGK